MSTKGDKVRAQMIEAANRLFYQRGFQATSFADIARASAIPKGNFYFHFKTKEALLEAVIQDRMERLQDQLNGWMDTLEDPKDRLKRAVRMMVNDQENIKQYGCPMGTLIGELAKTHPAQKGQLAKMLTLIQTWMADQIEELTSSPRDAQRMARQMLSNMQGAATLTAAFGDSDVIHDTVAGLDALIDNL